MLHFSIDTAETHFHSQNDLVALQFLTIASAAVTLPYRVRNSQLRRNSWLQFRNKVHTLEIRCEHHFCDHFSPIPKYESNDWPNVRFSKNAFALNIYEKRLCVVEQPNRVCTLCLLGRLCCELCIRRPIALCVCVSPAVALAPQWLSCAWLNAKQFVWFNKIAIWSKRKII